MVPPRRDTLRVVEVAFAVAVLAIAALLFAQQPRPWSSWPTAGGVAVDPELWLPGLLAVAAMLGAVADGLGVGSAVAALLAVPTLLLAGLSVYALTTGTAGGVFWGGFLTLAAATPLALAVLGRVAVRSYRRRDAARGSPAADG